MFAYGLHLSDIECMKYNGHSKDDLRRTTFHNKYHWWDERTHAICRRIGGINDTNRGNLGLY